MIKCPNCGSTAQVRVRSTVDTYDEKGNHEKIYHCDCGCGEDFFHYSTNKEEE